MISQLLTGTAGSVWVQLFRYTLVGGAAFAIDVSVLVLLTEVFGLHYLLSAAAGFLAGLLVNYSLSVSWVFSRRSVTSRRLEFALFAAIGLTGLGLNELLIYAFTELAGVYYIYSKILTTAIVYLWNFIARKISLFR